jgi:hypothetical protein
MGAKSGTALKFLQWFLRGVQFLCCALVLGVYSYFLATLHNHDLNISRDVKAVEGISGVGVIYTLLSLLLLCCLAGIKVISLIAIVLDLAFIGAFIFVAVANKNGASDCKGYLDTPFGQGQSDNTANGSDGFTALPSFHVACRLQSACLGVAIIAIIFFILTILTEVGLARHHHKAKRFGPSPQNNYTSGYGDSDEKGGFFSRLFGRKKGTVQSDENHLPAHTTPDQIDHTRQSYATETTAVNNNDNPYVHNGDQSHATNGGYNKNETGYGYPTASHPAQQTGYSVAPNDYRYGDGVYDRV